MPGRSWEGVHTKRGTRERRPGRSRLSRPRVPSPRCQPVTTPPIVAPSAARPLRPGPGDEAGSHGERGGPDLPRSRGLRGSRGHGARTQTRDGPALAAAPRRCSRGRWGGRAGVERGAHELASLIHIFGVLPSTALASAPAGRWGRAAGEGRAPAVAAAAAAVVAAAGPARWRGGAAGRREAEKARRGRLPSGGLREMQLSLCGCCRGHKWGRSGRSGAARAPGPRLRHPQTLSPDREAGIGVRRPTQLPGIGGKGIWGTLGQVPRCIPAPSALIAWLEGREAECGDWDRPFMAGCGASWLCRLGEHSKELLRLGDLRLGRFGKEGDLKSRLA
ncbi:hypothetical protein NN561_003083 [Cricetulus griseus]